MPENQVSEKVDVLGGKIARMIYRMQKLEAKVKVLEEQNEILRKEIQVITERYNQLNENQKTQTLTHLLTQGKEKAEVKAEIDRIVRDIDRCIGLLSQPEPE